MRPHLVITILIGALLSCNNKEANLTIQSNGRIVIVDSSGRTNNLWAYQSNERYGYYPIYYIGNQKDTIRLGPRKIPGRIPSQADYYSSKNIACADSSKLSLTVDTSFSLTHTDYYSHYSATTGKEIVDSTKQFKSFPIFVRNLCDSVMLLGRFSEVAYMIRQAKDEQGNWVDIEVPIRYSCGTGARHIALEPDQTIIAMLIRYKGDFKTTCRLKFSNWKGTIYSNTFTDYIDEKQLTESVRTAY